MQQKKSNVIRIDELANAMQSTTLYQIRKEKVRFSISKYHDCPIFTLELQNYTFYTTQLSKLDTLPLGVPCGKDCTLSIKRGLCPALLYAVPCSQACAPRGGRSDFVGLQNEQLLCSPRRATGIIVLCAVAHMLR